MWNGWTTGRRFQKTLHTCVLGCGSPCAEDSIEHYARCATAREVGIKYVGLRPMHYSRWLGNFVILGLNHGSVDDITLTKRAILVYAVFRTTDALRRSPKCDVEHIKDMLEQFCKEDFTHRGMGGASLDWESVNKIKIVGKQGGTRIASAHRTSNVHIRTTVNV